MFQNAVNLKNVELSRTKHPNSEVKEKDIILLGTPVTAEAWSRAEFKSADGTFKITPKLLYQTFCLLALYGGIYITCHFGLFLDKSAETYERFFGMLWEWNVREHTHKKNCLNLCIAQIAWSTFYFFIWAFLKKGGGL